MRETPPPGVTRRAFLKLTGLLALGTSAITGAIRTVRAGVRPTNPPPPAPPTGVAWWRVTTICRRALLRAEQEASRLHLRGIGPEHLLLGMAATECPGAAILKSLRVPPAQLRNEILREAQPGTAPPGQALGLTASAERALTLACDEADRLKSRYVGTEHLLLGLLREQKGLSAKVLGRHKVTADAVKREIAALEAGPARSRDTGTAK